MLWRYHEFASVLMQWINQLTKHKCKIIIGTLYFSYYIIIGTSYSVIVLVLVGCRHHVIYNSVGRLPSEYIHLSQTWKHTMRHLYLAMVQAASFFYIYFCLHFFTLATYVLLSTWFKIWTCIVISYLLGAKAFLLELPA